MLQEALSKRAVYPACQLKTLTSRFHRAPSDPVLAARARIQAQVALLSIYKQRLLNLVAAWTREHV